MSANCGYFVGGRITAPAKEIKFLDAQTFMPAYAYVGPRHACAVDNDSEGNVKLMHSILILFAQHRPRTTEDSDTELILALSGCTAGHARFWVDKS